jgi:hypothetical protein
MNHQIIRVSDGQVVKSNLTKEQAEKLIIFYDTESDPHKIQDTSTTFDD